jgi:alkanesulfonate monooxygenase SsuD/methylene tetrahydromethanopterin reductase-like flavin-dependent oxidoreductase (luciferase family)
MKFGIFDHLDRRDEPLGKFFDDRLKMVRAYDEAGFHSYHVAEHHGTPLGMAPSPNVFLGIVARETRRLRFGPMVYLLPLYHPVRLIEEICMLDHLSDGRIDVGVGRGVSPHESACYGVAPDDRRPMFEEGLEVLLKGLTSGRLNHQGKWYRVADVPMELRPLQQPYPPLWYGGSNAEGARYSARYGMHFVTLGDDARVGALVKQYPELWQATRNEPHRARSPVKTPLVGFGRQLFLAETDAEAERLARPAYAHWFGSVAKLWRDHGGMPVTGMLFDTFDSAKRAGAVIAGSPATARRELGRKIAEIGGNYLVCQFSWGNLGHEHEMRSLQMFVREVMPELAAL